MREILFRGKRTYDKQWVEGFFVVENDGDNPNPYIVNSRGKYQVANKSVGQFSGMTDANGKRIFEGDWLLLDEDVKKTFDVEDGFVRFGFGGFYVKEFGLLNSLNTLATFNGVLRGEII